MSTDQQYTEPQTVTQAAAMTVPPQGLARRSPTRPVVPIGTIAVVAFLFLNIVFLWMLVLGVQQGRA